MEKAGEGVEQQSTILALIATFADGIREKKKPCPRCDGKGWRYSVPAMSGEGSMPAVCDVCGTVRAGGLPEVLKAHGWLGTGEVYAYPALVEWAWTPLQYTTPGLDSKETPRWHEIVELMLGPAFEGAVKWTLYEAAVADGFEVLNLSGNGMELWGVGDNPQTDAPYTGLTLLHAVAEATGVTL